MNVHPSSVLSRVADPREVDVRAPNVVVNVNASEIVAQHGDKMPRERVLDAPSVQALINASEVTFQQGESKVHTTAAPAVRAIVEASALTWVPGESPLITAQAPEVRAVVQPSALRIEYAEAKPQIVDTPAVPVCVTAPRVVQVPASKACAPVELQAPPVSAIVKAPVVHQIEASEACAPVELQAPPVNAIVKASAVLQRPGEECKIELHAPPVHATVAPSNVHQTSRRDEVPQQSARLPRTDATGARADPHFSVNVGHANVGCQGTFVTNYFVVNPPASTTVPPSSSKSATSCEEVHSAEGDDYSWVATLAQVLLLCSGCAIARCFAEQLSKLHSARPESRRAMLVQLLSNPAHLTLTMGALVADLEAKLSCHTRPVAWAGSLMKPACESLRDHVPALARMHDLSNTFVHANANLPPAKTVLQIAGIPDGADVTGNHRVGDLSSQAGWVATANALIASSSDTPSPATPSPRGVFGSAATLDHLKEIGRGRFDDRQVTVFEMDPSTSALSQCDVQVVGVNKSHVEVKMSGADTTFNLPRRHTILLAACGGPSVPHAATH